MGIYIKGVGMPESCASCFASERCIIKQYNWSFDRPINCPLVPVPSHGALMDRDEFFAVCPELVDGYKQITDDLVVVPAEDGET